MFSWNKPDFLKYPKIQKTKWKKNMKKEKKSQNVLVVQYMNPMHAPEMKVLGRISTT